MDDDGKHASGDNSFLLSVAQHLGGGVALVLVVAGAFWGIGQVQGPEAGNPVIQQPDESLKPTDLATSPSTAAATDTETASAEPEDAPTTAPADEGTASETAAPTETASPGDVDPAAVSLQLLDAAGDGGERAAAAASALREDGYPVVAENRAARGYESSTLFYTEGHEEEARYLASQHPEFGVVELKPDNLSESVDVHVIIGEDYPTP